MLTKCSECQREVSDQAVACPHCGYPLRKDRVVARARTQLDAATRGAKQTGTVLKKIGIHTGKCVIVFVVLVIVGNIYLFVCKSCESSLTARGLVNIVLPAVWIPIAATLGLLYGSRAKKIAYRIFIVMIPISFLSECGQMHDSRILGQSESIDWLFPFVGKVLGFIWVLAVLKPRNKDAVPQTVTPATEAGTPVNQSENQDGNPACLASGQHPSTEEAGPKDSSGDRTSALKARRRNLLIGVCGLVVLASAAIVVAAFWDDWTKSPAQPTDNTKTGDEGRTEPFASNPRVKTDDHLPETKAVPETESTNRPSVKGQSFLVGGKSISVPVPCTNMVEAGSEGRKVMGALYGKAWPGRLVALFVPPNDTQYFPAMQSGTLDPKTLGNYKPFARMANILVSGANEFRNASTEDFLAEANKTLKRSAKEREAVTKYAEKKFNAAVKADDKVTIGSVQDEDFFLKDDACGHVLVIPVTNDGDSMKIAQGVSIVRVRQRIVYLYFGIEHKGVESVGEVRDIMEDWATRILKANE